MESWILWSVLAALFAVAELLTLALFMAPFSLGALLALGAGLLGAPLWLQAVVFLASSLLLVVALRPLARRHNQDPVLTGAAALVGQTVSVVEEVSQDGGLVKAAGGNWTARSEQTISAGEKVVIQEIDGVTLIVIPKEENPE